MTKLGPEAEQVEYRLAEAAGCTAGLDSGQQPAAGDAQLRYHLDGSDHGLTWFGEGLRDVGLAPGTAMTEAGKDAARALMAGVDPRTGAVLRAPKMELDPRGKLAAAPLAEAMAKAAAGRGAGGAQDLVAGNAWAAARLARISRGLDRQGEAHKVPAGDLRKVAAAAGLGLDGVYGAAAVAEAERFAGRHVRTGNRGYDLELDLPKSVSVLWALADPATAAGVERIYRSAVADTLAAVGQWCAYGERGHQGDGQRAERVAASGLLGWVMWHSTARPAGGRPPDPHLHAHAVIANLVRCDDGQWRAPAHGGKDIYRHEHAAAAYLHARIRRELTRAYGVTWARDEQTGVWEISGIGRELRETFSKRQGQLSQLLEAMGMTRESVTVRQANTAAASTREARQSPGAGGDLRAAWRAQAPGWGPSPAAGPGGPVPPAPSPAQLATAIFDPGHGVTAHAKTVSRATVLAAVLDALPGGAADLAEAEQLASEVLAQADGPAVRLPDGLAQLTNRQRYTSADVVAAERDVLAAARTGWQAGLAAIPAGAAALAIAATEASAGTSLSGEQRAAVTRLLTEGHGVDAIIGAPGAGKTTLMAAARAGWQAAGLTVAGAATAAVAAQGLHAGSGIPSATIASWLARIQSGPGLAGVDVLVVDEAAMADDRHLARLLEAAASAGTKVVLTGDPVQLRAIGVGSTFAAVHQQIAGLTLTQNLRQRDPAERQALTLWREGGRDQALRTWAAAGRVHAGEGREDTLAAMAADWAAARAAWAGDPHGELAGVALLAGTNADTGTLNELARAIRRQAGEITGPEVAFRLAGGGTLRLAAGDHVRVRRYDYRSRRAAGDPDLLNGYRGIIREITPGRGAVAEWRRAGPDGPVTELATLSPADIASGIVSYGTAMTVAAAQGSTASTALVYGPGLDAHALYVAMSRDRDTARLYLPRQLLEDDTDRVRHGQAATPAEELQRAIDACARTLAADQPDRLVLTELGGVPSPIAHPPAVIPPESSPPAPPPVPAWATRPYGHHSDTALTRLDHALRSGLPRLTTRDQRITAAQTTARAGNGPTATALRARRGELTAAAAAAEDLPAAHRAAAAAAASYEQARQRHQNAQRHAAHSRAALLLAGTTPRQARDQLAATTRDLLAAQAREHDTRTRAAQLARITGDAAAAAGPARTWDQQMAAAIAADLRAPAAATPADLASVTFAQHHARTAADARQALDGIAAETSLRAAMPAAQRDQERAERTATAAARRAAATRDHPASRPEPRGVSRGPHL